jgi:hypothetical protein
MKTHGFPLLVLAGVLGTAVAAQAQAPGPGGPTPMQGFTSTALVAQLSLYLPPEATRGMYGGRGAGQGGGTQGGAGQGGGSRSALAFARDPKLYLTKDQIGRVLPILLSLRENPMPAPSRARQIQADVAGILTQAQKAEYERFRQAVQDLMQRFRQQAAANGGGGPAAGPGAMEGQRPGQDGAGPQMTPLQRRQRQLDAFIEVLRQRQQQADT